MWIFCNVLLYRPADGRVELAVAMRMVQALYTLGTVAERWTGWVFFMSLC